MTSDAEKSLKIDYCAVDQEEKLESENGQLSIVGLNDNVLIHVFNFLNWIDSIHFAETCERLNEVPFWKYKRSEEFSLNEYLEKGKIPIENVLIQYGPHIRRFSTELPDDITEDVVVNCINVQSLRFYGWPRDYTFYPDNIRLRINMWIKRSNVESLLFYYPLHLPQFCDGVTTLKELIEYPDHRNEACLERNLNVERLCIPLSCYFNFGILCKLQHLRCFHIRICSCNIARLLEFGNFSGLTEFSLHYIPDRGEDRLDNFNDFLKMLAERSKLDKLNIDCGNGTIINRDTFLALKLFNVTVLSLNSNFSSNDFTKFIRESPAARFKHLILRRDRPNQEILMLLVRNWKHLETICCSVRRDEYERFDESFINGILKMFTNRLPLTLEIHSCRTLNRIRFYFKSQVIDRGVPHDAFEIVDKLRIPCCVMKNVFGFQIVDDMWKN